MKYKPGQLVEITKTLDTDPKKGTIIDPIPLEYIGKLGIVVSFMQQYSTYRVLIDVNDDMIDVYEEEMELV
jgi:hypothetical protein